MPDRERVPNEFKLFISGWLQIAEIAHSNTINTTDLRLHVLFRTTRWKTQPAPILKFIKGLGLKLQMVF